MKQILSGSYLLTILVFIGLISCSPNENPSETPVGTALFEKAGYVSLSKVNQPYPYQVASINHLNEYGDYAISTFNRNDVENHIRLYDVNHDSVLHIIPLDSVYAKSKSNYPRIHGYYIHRPDSIFVTPFYTNEIFLINQNGQVLKKLDIPKMRVDSLSYDITSFRYPPFYLNQSLVTGQHYARNDYADNPETQEIFFSSDVEVIVDAASGQIEETAVAYPPLYQQGNYYRAIQSERATIHSDGNRIHSFHFYDSIKVASGIDDVKVRTYDAASDFFEMPPAFNTDSLQVSEFRTKYTTLHSKYLRIYYDPYRELIYRIVKHGTDRVNEDNTLNTPVDAPWSIVVLNKDFEKVYEQTFETKQYNYYLHFIINKDGVLIHLHPQHEKNNEKEWNYQLFKINPDAIS